jgi:hypothetical protein
LSDQQAFNTLARKHSFLNSKSLQYVGKEAFIPQLNKPSKRHVTLNESHIDPGTLASHIPSAASLRQ